MPQIGQLRQGLWVTSGFGRQGLNTSAIAGQLIARGILWGDDRWRLFSPFELVWAGGADRRGWPDMSWVCGAGGVRPRPALWRGYRERARAQERIREARLVEANRVAAGTRIWRSRAAGSDSAIAAGSRHLPGPVRPRLQNDQPPIAPEPVAVEPFTADPVTVDPPEQHDHS